MMTLALQQFPASASVVILPRLCYNICQRKKSIKSLITGIRSLKQEVMP